MESAYGHFRVILKHSKGSICLVSCLRAQMSLAGLVSFIASPTTVGITYRILPWTDILVLKVMQGTWNGWMPTWTPSLAGYQVRQSAEP